MTPEESKDYQVDTTKFKGCPHRFVRLGMNVECIKCGLGFFDPEGKFPLEEANKKFELSD